MTRGKAGAIRVGIGGWTFEPWRGPFYPPGLAHKKELDFASRHVTSIEVNGTYYGSQKPESFARWHDETPDGFVFSVKGPRFTTNRRVLAEAAPSIERFFASGVTALKAKLGPINWQFLPSKRFDPDDFAAFLALLPKNVDGVAIRHAVEVRHDSFRDPAFVDLLRHHGIAAVLADSDKFPEIPDITAPFVYARLQAASADIETGYSSESLDTWAERARTWAEGGIPATPAWVEPLPTTAASQPRDVFIYIINGHKPKAPAAAMALLARLGGDPPASPKPASRKTVAKRNRTD